MKLGRLRSKMIDQYAEKGNAYFDQGEVDKARKEYSKILDILPKPKTQWDAYAWAIIGIGDCYFMKQDFEHAYDYFRLLEKDHDAISNAFYTWRMGQCLYRLNRKEEALIFMNLSYLEDVSLLPIDEECYQYYLENNSDEVLFKSVAAYVPFTYDFGEDNDSDTKETPIWFFLPEKYEHLEQEFHELDDELKKQEIDWEKVYQHRLNLFKKIPDELITNTIYRDVTMQILEACVILNKISELEYWMSKHFEYTRNWDEGGYNDIWEGIVQFKLGNKEKAKEHFNTGMKNGGYRLIKKFYHLKNKAYKMYMNVAEDL